MSGIGRCVARVVGWTARCSSTRRTSPARAHREARAKQICSGCPVLDRCRAHALAVHEPYGVWGGLSESERDEIVRAKGRTLRVLTAPAPRIPSERV